MQERKSQEVWLLEAVVELRLAHPRFLTFHWMRCQLELGGLQGSQLRLVLLRLAQVVLVPSWSCLLVRSVRVLLLVVVRLLLLEVVTPTCDICRFRSCARGRSCSCASCNPRSPTRQWQCRTRHICQLCACGCSRSLSGCSGSLGNRETSLSLGIFRWELAMVEDLVTSSAHCCSQEKFEKPHG